MGRTPPGQTRERIFRFVGDRLLSGFPPTVREVKEAFGFRSVQTAREHLEALVKEGRLGKEKGKARGYRFPATEAPTRFVPLVGRVPAGPLDLAAEDLEGYIPIQTHHASGELFGLRVRGQSMTRAGILPGDIVVVQYRPDVEAEHVQGRVCACLVDGEPTLKRVSVEWRDGERLILLRGDNPRVAPLLIDGRRDFSIQGIVLRLVCREL